MKVLIGWMLGIATAWAALAIWQRLEIPDIDYVHPGHPDRIELSEERVNVQMRNKFPPPPVRDDKVHVTVTEGRRIWP